MTIKVQRTGGSEYGHWMKVLVAGDNGSGKTRFGRSWPNPFYLNADAGLMSVAGDKIPFTDIESSRDLEQLLVMLNQKPDVRESMLGVKVETIVVDTFDQISRMFIKERLLAERKETMTMADWGWLGDQLRGLARALRNLDMNVVFTCHIKTTQEEETGKVTVKPMLQGAMQDELAGYVDLALLLTARPSVKIENGESVKRLTRLLQSFPDAHHPWLKDRSGKLPMELEIDFEQDYTRIHGLVFAGLDTLAESSVVKEAEEVVATAPEPVAVPAKAAPAKKAAAAKKAAPKAEPKPDPVVTADPKVEAAKAEVAEAAVELQPELAPEPEAAPEPTPEPAPGPDVSMVCEECKGPIEDRDQADLSRIRFRKPMCRTCFKAAKK